MSGRCREARVILFWPSIAVLAAGLFLIFHALQKSPILPRQWARKQPDAADPFVTFVSMSAGLVE